MMTACVACLTVMLARIRGGGVNDTRISDASVNDVHFCGHVTGAGPAGCLLARLVTDMAITEEVITDKVVTDKVITETGIPDMVQQLQLHTERRCASHLATSAACCARECGTASVA